MLSTVDMLTFLKHKGIGQTKFESIAGLSRGYINNIKGSIGTTILNKISNAFPDLNIEWLLTGEGEMLMSTNATHISDSSKIEKTNTIKDKIENYKLLPLMNQDVVGGIKNEVVDTMGYITGYMPFVNAQEGDIAVPVTNDSMYPTYSPGSIVQIRKIERWREFIESGQVYIIELKDGRRLIKEVKKAEDKEHLILVSHNHRYGEDEIDKDLIRSVWLVISKYQKCVM